MCAYCRVLRGEEEEGRILLGGSISKVPEVKQHRLALVVEYCCLLFPVKLFSCGVEHGNCDGGLFFCCCAYNKGGGCPQWEGTGALSWWYDSCSNSFCRQEEEVAAELYDVAGLLLTWMRGVIKHLILIGAKEIF